MTHFLHTRYLFTRQNAVRLVIGIGVVLFGLFKIQRFESFAYLYSDLFCALQMSFGWLDGRPLLYENYYGNHAGIHNYYVALPLGFLTRQAGAHAFFAVQIGLIAVVLERTIQQLSARRVSWPILILGFLVGPITFWLNDHPLHGFHLELLYFPLGLLFGVALRTKRWGWIVLSGMGLLLVREDGALLLAALFTVHRMVSNWLGSSYRITKVTFWPDRYTVFLVLASLALMLVALRWLDYKSHTGPFAPRSTSALKTLLSHLQRPEFYQQFALPLLARYFLLLLPALGGLMWLIRKVDLRVQVHIVGLIVVILMCLGLSGLLQTTFYLVFFPLGTPFLDWIGPTWPPRFVMSWTVICHAVITIVAYQPNQTSARPHLTWLVAGLLVLTSAGVLSVVRRGYSLPTLVAAAVKGELSGTHVSENWEGFIEVGSVPAWPEVAQLRAWAEALPQTDIYVQDPLRGIFHRHFTLWNAGHNYRPARVALFSRGTRMDTLGWRMNYPYHVYQSKHLEIWVDSSIKTPLPSFLRPVSEVAGGIQAPFTRSVVPSAGLGTGKLVSGIKPSIKPIRRLPVKRPYRAASLVVRKVKFYG